MNDLPSTFWDSIERYPSGCWLWQKCRNNSGYGFCKIKGKLQGTHRHMYAYIHGGIPTGMCVLHKCDIRHCVNPFHLILGTQADNMVDRARKRRWQPKLSSEDVAHIRSLITLGIKQKTIADQFSVSQSMISTIKLLTRRQHDIVTFIA